MAHHVRYIIGQGATMSTVDFNIWLKAFEQEIVEVAQRIEAIRKKLLNITTIPSSDSGSLTQLNNSLVREIVNLRQLSQRANFKGSQIMRTEAVTKQGL
jgi:hypothetical protein